MQLNTKDISHKSDYLLYVFFFLLFVCCLLSFVPLCLGLTDEEILINQSQIKDMSIGQKIAFWAERFVGVPYDNDPEGEYVSKGVIVADERVDCMYLTFRAVELAMSNRPDEAIGIALDKRFHTKGILKNGKVLNYDERFEYGEDMIFSGKWGSEITTEIGKTRKIEVERLSDSIEILPPEGLIRQMQKLKDGDIVFFIRDPKKSIRKELVGHIGIIKTEDRQVYLIHASGIKGKGGIVKKVLFKDYIKKMPFMGAKITRFY